MNIDQEYNKFIKRYPQYAPQIVSYKEYLTNGIELTFIDGKVAYYFPWETEEETPKKVKSKKK